ncbi:hypothetical protein ACFE04_021331 [Oxalis oulophora]
MEIEREASQLVEYHNCIKCMFSKLMNSVVNGLKSIKKVGEDDPRRVIHSLKVGIALTLVSLFYYTRPIYDSFGTAGMWAVLTVVVVFEYTVGATLSKGINRCCATLVAGALGVGAQHLATLFGDKGEPIVLGILVFLIGTVASFTRFIPWIKARFDYGVLIFILTFSLVTISGYRVEKILVLAHQRISTIVIGGAACIVISICICPVWAGEELHNLLASNIDKLATYLQDFGSELYFQTISEEVSGCISKRNEQIFFTKYKGVLNTKSTEESLAIFARWEPGHGRFQLRFPWKQYLKIGTLVRQCAYQIDTLNTYIISLHDIQVPRRLQPEIEESCIKMSLESGMALKALASSIKTMSNPSLPIYHVENSKTAINELQIALGSNSIIIKNNEEVLPTLQAATIASILTEIVN